MGEGSDQGEHFLNIMKLSSSHLEVGNCPESQKKFKYQYIPMPNEKMKKAKLEGTIDIWSFSYENGKLCFSL